jgi:glyoxylase-like metal-dependent hydrolase (beta-lactamase superfamily II)
MSSPEHEPFDPAELAAGVWRITTPMPYRPRSVHAYLVRGADSGWFLLDGGIDSEEAWAALDGSVRSVIGDWRHVRLQVVSHMHSDHLGLLRRALAATGADLAMGELDAERARHAAAEPKEEAEYRAALLVRCGAPGSFGGELAKPAGTASRFPAVRHPLPCGSSPLPGCPDWAAVWTPGHTAGHISLFRASDRLLLAGDAILPRVTPTIGVNRQRADPVADYLGALARLEELRPERALCGHGAPLEDVVQRIGELRTATQAEGRRVAAVLESGPLSTWEVVERLYPARDLPTGPRVLALRETLAHLEHGVARGAFERREREGVSLFCVR